MKWFKLGAAAFVLGVCAASGGAYAQMIEVQTPNGGEVWAAGTTQTIYWNRQDVPSDVTIWLYNNYTKIRTLGTAGPTAHQITWNIPQNELAGNTYRIRVGIPGEPGYNDYSDGTFTITSAVPKSVTVTSPNGGESWGVTEPHLITWTSAGLLGNVRIYLYDHWTKLSALTTVPIQNGSWEWTPPDTLCGPIYRIRIQSLSDTSVNDYSDNLFTLTTTIPPMINVFTPVGGATLFQGGTGDVNWESMGLWGNARIYLYYNWTKLGIIGTVPVAQWNWTWNVPLDQTPGDAYRIRVQSLVNTVVNGYSEKFTVLDAAGGGK